MIRFSNWLAAVLMIASVFLAGFSPQERNDVQQQRILPAEKSNVATFLVVRHAEREGNEDRLSAAGLHRAEILGELAETLRVNAIYSTDFERTRKTGIFSARKRQREIQLYEQPTDEWIAGLRERHRGEVVLIIGHSNTAGVIAGLLGETDPFEIDHDQYDSLFVVTSDGEQSAVVRLNYGPSSTGAPSAAADQMGPIRPGGGLN